MCPADGVHGSTNGTNNHQSLIKLDDDNALDSRSNNNSIHDDENDVEAALLPLTPEQIAIQKKEADLANPLYHITRTLATVDPYNDEEDPTRHEKRLVVRAFGETAIALSGLPLYLKSTKGTPAYNQFSTIFANFNINLLGAGECIDYGSSLRVKEELKQYLAKSSSVQRNVDAALTIGGTVLASAAQAITTYHVSPDETTFWRWFYTVSQGVGSLAIFGYANAKHNYDNLSWIGKMYDIPLAWMMIGPRKVAEHCFMVKPPEKEAISKLRSAYVSGIRAVIENITKTLKLPQKNWLLGLSGQEAFTEIAKEIHRIKTEENKIKREERAADAEKRRTRGAFTHSLITSAQDVTAWLGKNISDAVFTTAAAAGNASYIFANMKVFQDMGLDVYWASAASFYSQAPIIRLSVKGGSNIGRGFYAVIEDLIRHGKLEDTAGIEWQLFPTAFATGLIGTGLICAGSGQGSESLFEENCPDSIASEGSKLRDDLALGSFASTATFNGIVHLSAANRLINTYLIYYGEKKKLGIIRTLGRLEEYANFIENYMSDSDFLDAFLQIPENIRNQSLSYTLNSREILALLRVCAPSQFSAVPNTNGHVDTDSLLDNGRAKAPQSNWKNCWGWMRFFDSTPEYDDEEYNHDDQKQFNIRGIPDMSQTDTNGAAVVHVQGGPTKQTPN